MSTLYFSNTKGFFFLENRSHERVIKPRFFGPNIISIFKLAILWRKEIFWNKKHGNSVVDLFCSLQDMREHSGFVCSDSLYIINFSFSRHIWQYFFNQNQIKKTSLRGKLKLSSGTISWLQMRLNSRIWDIFIQQL